MSLTRVSTWRWVSQGRLEGIERNQMRWNERVGEDQNDEKWNRGKWKEDCCFKWRTWNVSKFTWIKNWCWAISPTSFWSSGMIVLSNGNQFGHDRWVQSFRHLHFLSVRLYPSLSLTYLPPSHLSHCYVTKKCYEREEHVRRLLSLSLSLSPFLCFSHFLFSLSIPLSLSLSFSPSLRNAKV